jgi:predicted HTH transcriptional regulator
VEPDLEMLINHGEDTKVEYKRTYKLSEKAVKAELIRDILAMVNAHEQSTGYILIGVDEKTQQLHDAIVSSLFCKSWKYPCSFLSLRSVFESRVFFLLGK